MTQPTQRADHADHDLFVLAAAADRNVDVATRAAADLQIAACPECARLHADLLAISAEIRELPHALPAPRDFRISADQAQRLRRSDGWRRLLRPFGPAGVPALRPLAAGFTTLGLAGLLFTIVLPAALGGFGTAAGSAPNPAVQVPASQGGGGFEYQPPKAGESSVPALNAGNPGDAQASPAPTYRDLVGLGASPVQDNGGRMSTETFGAGPTSGSGSPWLWVTILSVALFAAGLVLLGLRLAARRLE
jgi:anti-sigma factor RsiW